MGANAQTAVPVFTAGQVLTAAQVTQINTGIPVFATTTTRDAAFGGTGEKTLAEGQMAYIEASNTTQYYDGSSWLSTNGLQWIATANPSAAATVTIDNCFSTAYKFYVVLFDLTGGVSQDLRFQFRYGTTTQASGYYGGFNTSYFNGATGSITNNNAAFLILNQDSGTQITGSFNISAVGVSAKALITGQTFSVQNAEASSGGGYVNSTQTYTGFILSNSAGDSIFTGTVSVYGVVNS
jgi:hypothetical protein